MRKIKMAIGGPYPRLSAESQPRSSRSRETVRTVRVVSCDAPISLGGEKR